ncbi:MAG: GAF domain-containing protein [Bacilli bacterium]
MNNIILKQIQSILDTDTKSTYYRVTCMSNISSLLYNSLDDINWLGFYLKDCNRLVAGPFQGKTASTPIEFSKGVVGACAEKCVIINVPNTSKFEGHIACDIRSRSEIVFPIIIKNTLYAILDIDSPNLNRFKDEDIAMLKKVVKLIEQAF